MANSLNWQLGHEGKGNVYNDGSISTWNINRDNEPHHYQKGQEDEKTPRFHFYVSPEGGLWDGGTTFNNQTPYSDDQVVADVVAQHPAVYDARHELSMDWDGEEPEERIEMPGGGYGHAYDLLNVMSKLGVNSNGWADFHTELKLPRDIRKKIRRWVDRLDWPEGHEKEDARRYHITILSMDEYDEDFAKWARKEIRGKVFSFKTTGMDIFGGEHVVCRLDCPEWTALVQEWQKIADKKGLEPRKFDPPKAHVTIGKSPEGKWPQGIPNPHLKFDTRRFNINKNSMAIDPTFLDQWIQENGPYMYHGAKSRRGADPEMVAQAIEQQGIIPHGGTEEPNVYPGYQDDMDGYREDELLNWWQAPRPGHTYMASDPSMAYGNPMFRIDLRKLDPSKLKADEDLMEEEAKWPHFGPLSNPATEGQPMTLGDQAEKMGWGDDPNDTARSLENRGSIAHEGIIPPEAIERIDNIKKSGSETTPADDLKLWLDSFSTEQDNQPPSLHHTDGDDFTPQIVAPVVQTPHVDPPSKPYAPYNWAEEGWEENPLEMNRYAAIDTHICPKCGEDSNSPICATCGHDPQNSPSDYQQMKNDWYDRAWSVPGNQPRPIPNQPMHWRDDHAKNVSLARKETNDLDHSREWSVESVTSAWQPINDMPSVWHREPDSVEISQGKDPSNLSGLRKSVSRASSLGTRHGF